MHAVDKIFVKTYLKAIRDTLFPNMWNVPICGIFIPQNGKIYSLRLAERPLSTPSPQFPSLAGDPDLPMMKTLRVVDLLTAMVSFQSKKFTAYKTKDEKEETNFYFLMVLNLLKIIHSFQSKNHLRT